MDKKEIPQLFDLLNLKLNKYGQYLEINNAKIGNVIKGEDTYSIICEITTLPNIRYVCIKKDLKGEMFLEIFHNYSREEIPLNNLEGQEAFYFKTQYEKLNEIIFKLENWKIILSPGKFNSDN